MNKLVSAFLVAVLCFFSSFSTALAEGRDAFLHPESNLLKIAVEEDYRPFSYIDSSGTRVGFDVGFAELLCTQLRVKCELVPLVFSKIIPAIDAGEVDLAIASVGYTKERARILAFSQPYFRSRSVFIGTHELGYELNSASASGLTIATQVGSLQEEALKQGFSEKNKIITFDDYADMFKAVASGKADVLLADGLGGYQYLKEDKSGTFVLLNTLGVDVLPMDSACVVMSKRHETALPELNEAIYHLKLSGEYQMLSLQYFPFMNY